MRPTSPFSTWAASSSARMSERGAVPPPDRGANRVDDVRVSHLPQHRAATFRNALQLVLAALVEPNPEPATRSFTVLETSTSPGLGERRYARPGHDGDSGDLLAHELALARVDAGAHVEIELRAPSTIARACHGARRSVEPAEEAVARGVDLVAAEARQLATDASWCLRAGRASSIAKLRGALVEPTRSVKSTVASTESGLRRAPAAEELENRVRRLSTERRRALGVQPEQPRSTNPARNEACRSRLRGIGRFARSVEDEGRHPDRAEDPDDVGLHP